MSKKKDGLSKRMKEFYEERTRTYLPRRTHTIIRIDGKCFSTYTKGLKEPFDEGLIQDMDNTAKYLCKNIQGAKFAYVQSDEISILVTDYDQLSTAAWFDGNIQKITSIAASMATAEFNRLRLLRKFRSTVATAEVIMENFKVAMFDARIFSIPSREEVLNYFIWRQKDCVRNSIQSVAQSLYSHEELKYKKENDMQELIFQKGQNWNDYPSTQKRGRVVLIETIEIDNEFNGTTSPFKEMQCLRQSFTRSRWVSTECPTFTQDREFLYKLFPVL